MTDNLKLGDLEAQVLSAVARIGENAYGVPIRREVGRQMGREVSVGALYTVLERLEQKGYVRSWEGEPTRERGGRAKRFFRIEGLGERALLLKEREYRQRAAGLRAGLAPQGGGA